MSEAVPSAAPVEPAEPGVTAAVPRGQRFALVAGLIAVALLVAYGIAFGLGGRPRSPEELYELVAKLTQESRMGEVWDLQTEDAKQEFRDTISGHRNLMTRNPGLTMTDQYHCSRDEFMTLPFEEIYSRENRGRERVFAGAKIIAKDTDPRFPDEVVLTIEPPAGPLVLMQARKVGRGWGLVRCRVLTR